MSRKPHADNAGYLCELKARLGGHVGVYDRKNGFELDAGERWIVMHEPSSKHVAMPTERAARETMQALARARTLHEARLVADVFPGEGELEAAGQDPAEPELRRCTCYVLPHADDCELFIGITQSGARVFAAVAPPSSRRQLEALERYWNATTFVEERAAWRELVEASPARKGGRQ